MGEAIRVSRDGEPKLLVEGAQEYVAHQKCWVVARAKAPKAFAEAVLAGLGVG